MVRRIGFAIVMLTFAVALNAAAYNEDPTYTGTVTSINSSSMTFNVKGDDSTQENTFTYNEVPGKMRTRVKMGNHVIVTYRETRDGVLVASLIKEPIVTANPPVSTPPPAAPAAKTAASVKRGMYK